MNQIDAYEKLERYYRARYPIIGIISHEENRVMKAVQKLAEDRSAILGTWTITEGLQIPEISDHPKDPIASLLYLLNLNKRRFIIVFKDLHNVIATGNPTILRALRDVAFKFETCEATLVLLSPHLTVPGDLDKQVALIDWPLPDNKELAAILQEAESRLRRRNEDMPGKITPITLNGGREQVVAALRGLTATEAQAVISAGIVATRELGDSLTPFIVKEKAQIIRKSGVLEYYDQTVTMNEVGGLQALKEHAGKVRAAFSAAAQEAGVDAPKGVILVGLPGTGKSLAVKAIAGGKLPLLRMDIGNLMGKYVGSSEENMRQAQRTAEAVAPCVLWIDEIDKGLGGGGGELDGGTSARVFGSFLTWMQETQAPIFVAATANHFAGLDSALVRRFDEIFWVDLPDQEARVEILAIHLKRRKQDPARFDLERIAKECWSYSGGELEKVVKAALMTAFWKNEPLTTDHLLDAAEDIVPQYESSQAQMQGMRDQIKKVRQAGKALEQKPQPVSAGVDLD